MTQLAALTPARRATRVPPIAALQRGDQELPSRHRRWRPWLAGLVALLGVGMLVAGLFGSGPATSRLSTMAVGVVLLFVGVALSARWFVRPLAGAVGGRWSACSPSLGYSRARMPCAIRPVPRPRLRR